MTLSGKCILCGSEDAELIFSGPDRLLGLPGTYSVICCRSCGLARTEPQIPVEQRSIYFEPDEGAEQGKNDRVNQYQGRLATRIDRAVKSESKRRVLDIGCNDGAFLELMRYRGWDAMGVELGEESSRVAREEKGLSVVTGDMFNQELPPGAFDAVVMSHVLEHLADPIEALKRIHTLLKPGGMLMLSLPNYSSPEAKIFKKNWYCWALPPHLYHFNRRSVGAAIEKAGLRVDKVTYLPFFFIVQNLRFVRGTGGLNQATPDSEGDAPAKRSGVKDFLKTIIFRSMLTTANITGRFMPGEIMEIEARKPRA